MQKIVLWCMSTLTVLVLLFGYHTSTSGAAGGGTSAQTPITGGTGDSAPAPAGTATASAPATGDTGAPASSAAPAPASSATPAPASTTVTGAVTDTRYGPIEVQLTVADKKITHVSVLEYPSGDGRDQEINSRALPVLVQETLQAQSATIDMVSGATYTSEGYLTSLQSALDKAGR